MLVFLTLKLTGFPFPSKDTRGTEAAETALAAGSHKVVLASKWVYFVLMMKGEVEVPTSKVFKNSCVSGRQKILLLTQ